MTTGHTRLAIGIWLEPCGFRAADGDESGLAALNDGTFDLMIVDVFMPHMRGFESIVVFHGHAPTVPLIAISRYAFSASERRADMTRVLIVDDDPMVCAAIEIYLERHGFDVTIADGGEAGLRALEDSSFDLMLVDTSCRTCVASNRSGYSTSARRRFR